jgi:hypothetical protein
MLALTPEFWIILSRNWRVVNARFSESNILWPSCRNRCLKLLGKELTFSLERKGPETIGFQPAPSDA